MRWLFISLFCVVFLLGAQTPPQEQPLLSTPSSGGAVQGSFSIAGNTDLPDFQYAEISFSYSGGSSNNWFLIQQSFTPVKSGMLAVWDTTTIADGVYQLRLQVFLSNGKILETLATGIRVRNYTAVETSTAAPQQNPAAVLPVASPTPLQLTATARQTPTGLPANPVQVPASSLVSSLAWGVGAALFFFVIFLLYQAVHNQEKSA